MNSGLNLKPLELLEQRCQSRWLMEQDNSEFWAIAQSLYQEFSTLRRASSPQKQPVQSILLSESNPLRFLAGFFAAYATTQQVFLGNPQWGTTEWQQAVAIAQPDYIWGDRAPLVQSIIQSMSNELSPSSPQVDPVSSIHPPIHPLILIPTGGSSGHIRFVMHSWDTLVAAVQGFQQYFQMQSINSICVLPLHHVSGLMQVMRSLLSDGHLWLTPFKSLKQGHVSPFSQQDWCISLVPTQLHALLQSPPTARWLAQCRTVFIGGAASWPELLHQARAYHIPLSLCYGMTETAAQCTALKPQDFLAGQQNVGQVFPHAHVLVITESGNDLSEGSVEQSSIRTDVTPAPSPHSIGRIYVAADSLSLGYYPTGWPIDQNTITLSGVNFFRTDDGGYFDKHSHLTLVGRLSTKIITGGENVFPAEVEAAIWATGCVMDVAVVGIPDEYWGQCVAAVYVPKAGEMAAATISESPSVSAASVSAASVPPPVLMAKLHHRIARYKQPKVWVPVATVPRNLQGKVDRKQLEAMCLSFR